jgi:hypothetical protein
VSIFFVWLYTLLAQENWRKKCYKNVGKIDAYSPCLKGAITNAILTFEPLIINFCGRLFLIKIQFNAMHRIFTLVIKHNLGMALEKHPFLYA